MILSVTGWILNLSLLGDFNFEIQLDNYLNKCLYLFGIEQPQNILIHIQPFQAGIENLPKFTEYHSMNNKQNDPGYNPRAYLRTASIVITYNDFDNAKAYLINERINLFLQDVFSRILGFLQSRRIIIQILQIQNSQKTTFAMPPFLAGSFIDSTAYGDLLIPEKNLDQAIQNALISYFSLTKQQQFSLIGLLKRYNDLLNLPYSYERAESIWKIIEALSNTPLLISHDEQRLISEYNRLLAIIGAKQSNNLKAFLQTLLAYNIEYTDEKIKNSWIFRNENTHEFLNFSSLSQNQDNAYTFLIGALRKILLKLLNIDELSTPVGCLCIDGRVF